ncbi:MAG: hypothetical protein IPN34_01415 [Planctomycetes bacterium]|nr:hypothetical protein [Planctomycetota bacterium]
MNEWQLRLASTGPGGTRFALTQRMHLVGSGRSCDLQIVGLPIEGFQLWRDGDSYRLASMGPAGSVRIGGAPADERVLAEGDLVECGGIALCFERAGATGIASAAAPSSVPQPQRGAQAEPSSVAPSSSSAPRWVAVAAAAWIAEQGKLEKSVQQKWEKVLRDGGSWSAEECAAEVLAAAKIDDQRPQAAVHALRDALAKRLIRAAYRGVARKRLVARLVVQLFVFAIVGGAVIGAALVLRTTFGIDWNALLDGLLGGVRRLGGGAL